MVRKCLLLPRKSLQLLRWRSQRDYLSKSRKKSMRWLIKAIKMLSSNKGISMKNCCKVKDMRIRLSLRLMWELMGTLSTLTR